MCVVCVEPAAAAKSLELRQAKIARGGEEGRPKLTLENDTERQRWTEGESRLL